MSCWCNNAPGQVTMLLGFTRAQLGQLFESDMVMSQHCFLLTVTSVLTTMKDGVPEQLCNTDPKGSGPEQRKLRIFDTNDHVVLDGIFHDLSCQVIQLVSLTDFHFVNKRKILQTVWVINVTKWFWCITFTFQCHRVATGWR